MELPGGHISLIAGRGAAVHCWPKVVGLAGARSGDESWRPDDAAVRHVEASARRGHAGVDQAWWAQVRPPARPPIHGLLAPGLNQGLEAWARMFAQTPASPDLAGPVEAVPRSVDRGVVAGARPGHGHRRLRPDDGQQLAGADAGRAGARQEGRRPGDGPLAGPAQPSLPRASSPAWPSRSSSSRSRSTGRGRRPAILRRTRTPRSAHDRQDDRRSGGRGPRGDHARRRPRRHRGVRGRGRRLQPGAQRSRLRRHHAVQGADRAGIFTAGPDLGGHRYPSCPVRGDLPVAVR